MRFSVNAADREYTATVDQLLDKLQSLDEESEKRKRILALLDCHFLSTAMLRISNASPERRALIETRIVEILADRSLQ
jgi:hypothetical protein